MRRLNLPKERTFTGAALLWKRIAAFFIDIIVLNFVLFPFKPLLRRVMPSDYSFSEAYSILSSANYSYISSITIVMSILVILYFMIMEKKMSQTIGKRLVGIYVVSDSNALKAWQLLARNMVFIPVFPFVLLWVLDPVFMFFTKTNQRLSEILSRTRVVERFSLGA